MVLKFFLFFLITYQAIANDDNIIYTKPKTFDFITNIPHTLKESWNSSFNTKPETIGVWAGVISSSVIFYIYDEKIYKHTKIFAKKIGLGNDDHTKPMVKIGNFNIFRGPTDTGSAMYFIGDGWLQAFTAGAFVLSGSINDDNRARQTGSQILNSLISASIPIQVLKRATGREDPNRASRYRGNWRPFNKNYINDVSAYDAVPSGHMMAATSTLTVIDSNYPEYQTIVRPVGLTLLSLLGFQMVNNGVHWISDYPLGIAIGYVFGRVASAQGKTSSEGHKISDWSILPIYSNDHEHQIFGTAFSMSY